MASASSYPTGDAGRAPAGALVASVTTGSPADDAGFTPGCIVTSADGAPIRDVIDWRWAASEECVTLGYVDEDGDAGEVELWREPGEEWGLEFEGLVFDGVRQCRNACSFCFMRMLPQGMRASLYVRDDDFRLSFLVGTFVTLTNLTPADEARICEQHISPLRVSLQAARPDVRARLIGKHADAGLAALERLLAAGIEFHAQVVLVPEVNDGEVLRDTLEWAYARKGILSVGVVPLGYTRHQATFEHSFNDPAAARGLLELLEPFQRRAERERGGAWVFAADEFYRNAWPRELVSKLPPASFYGDFSMFEDGIGIIRSVIDDWQRARSCGALAACARALREAGARAYLLSGLALREFLDELVAASELDGLLVPLYVENEFFGGNVDVTGLLVGADMARAVAGVLGGARAGAQPAAPLFFVLSVVFNDDGLTLDDMTLADMEALAGTPLHVVTCSPAEYLAEIAEVAQHEAVRRNAS